MVSVYAIWPLRLSIILLRYLDDADKDRLTWVVKLEIRAVEKA